MSGASPWEVLGIESSQDLRELKKAYLRQIDIHSPELDPEGFQRVRSAYEEARLLVEHGLNLVQGDPIADQARTTALGDVAIETLLDSGSPNVLAHPVQGNKASGPRSL